MVAPLLAAIPVLLEPLNYSGNRCRERRQRLTELDRQWLAASPFCVIATTDAHGNCDVSPKGDPQGLAHVLDDTTLVLPERPGNRRGDGFHNILENPRVGLLFVIPGRGDTLRINGNARIVNEAPFFDALEVNGHRPKLAIVVAIEQVFFHCSKAFLRAHLWQPESWKPDVLPSRPAIAKAMEHTGLSLTELEQYYGAAYAAALYKG